MPVYGGDAGRNPVLLGRAAFGLVDEATGDRGLGPLIAAHPELVREIPVRVEGGNPDVDTRADLVAVAGSGLGRARPREQRAGRPVPRGPRRRRLLRPGHRAVPGRPDADRRAGPRWRCSRWSEPGETWLDIGAGAGRYALPIALALAPSGGRVIAVDPSAGMLDALREIAGRARHRPTSRSSAGRWPPLAGTAPSFAADVALIAHVGYDIEAIGPFVGAMEAVARRLCVAVLMERQPASIADACWPPVHGEERVPLPALPDFVELLRARGREPSVELLEREPRRFDSRDELEGFLRRQLWVEPGSRPIAGSGRRSTGCSSRRRDGRVGLRGQQPLPIGIVTWAPSDVTP